MKLDGGAALGLAAIGGLAYMVGRSGSGQGEDGGVVERLSAPAREAVNVVMQAPAARPELAWAAGWQAPAWASNPINIINNPPPVTTPVRAAQSIAEGVTGAVTGNGGDDKVKALVAQGLAQARLAGFLDARRLAKPFADLALLDARTLANPFAGLGDLEDVREKAQEAVKLVFDPNASGYDLGGLAPLGEKALDAVKLVFDPNASGYDLGGLAAVGPLARQAVIALADPLGDLEEVRTKVVEAVAGVVEGAKDAARAFAGPLGGGGEPWRAVPLPGGLHLVGSAGWHQSTVDFAQGVVGAWRWANRLGGLF